MSALLAVTQRDLVLCVGWLTLGWLAGRLSVWLLGVCADRLHEPVRRAVAAAAPRPLPPIRRVVRDGAVLTDAESDHLRRTLLCTGDDDAADAPRGGVS